MLYSSLALRSLVAATCIGKNERTSNDFDDGRSFARQYNITPIDLDFNHLRNALYKKKWNDYFNAKFYFFV